MAGETDLAVLLASLRPVLAEERYGFASVAFEAELPPTLTPIGIFREAEGLTIIAPTAQCGPLGEAVSASWAMITLAVHSSLAAVGMIAAIAGALARAGISCNPVSGYHHDHIFVPWDRRHDAMRILAALSERG